MKTIFSSDRRFPKASGILQFAQYMSLPGAGSCGASAIYRADPSEPLVTQPGLVAVDVQARRKILGPEKIKQMCSTAASDIPLLRTLNAPSGYGLDDRYNPVSRAFRQTGTACFSGDSDAC